MLKKLEKKLNERKKGFFLFFVLQHYDYVTELPFYNVHYAKTGSLSLYKRR